MSAPRRPRVPGLSDEWADLQLALDVHGAVDGDGQPLAPVCSSCTALSQAGAWLCDPDRPGCPLSDVPEQSR